MDLLQTILTLRPTNAATRLGAGSPLPLLSPGDLLRAREGQAGALVCIGMPAATILPGLLRAARDQDAVVGFGSPLRAGQRDGAARFFDALRDAAGETSHGRPVFLQAGPIRPVSAEARAIEAMAGDVYRFVDAGFTSLSLDLSGLDPDAAPHVATQLSRAAVERELPVEVAPPELTREGLASYLEAQLAEGLEPQLVRIRSNVILPEAIAGAEPEPDFDLLRDLLAIASEHGAILSLDDRGTPHRRLSGWPAAGVRKVDVSEPFSRAVLAAMSDDARTRLRGRADSSGVPVYELLAQLEDPLFGLSPARRDRVEAVAYAEACSLFDALGATGTATAVMEKLAAKDEP